jgi:preprotein translocase subunit SecF
VVTALFILGGGVIHDFAFALIVGVLVGTYSSIFVASPVLIAWEAKFASPRVRVKGKR